ncbi:MAG: BrnT family toxin [Candidatus Binatia bacterium]
MTSSFAIKEVAGIKIPDSFRFLETGDVEGEDLYAALGRTAAGRYLIVYFIYKATKEALIISAREMTRKEKQAYAKK